MPWVPSNRFRVAGVLCSIASACAAGTLARADAAPGWGAPVHGLWVWKSPSVLQAPQGAQALQAFCQNAGINEVYVSFPATLEPSEGVQLARLIALLHHSGIRAEALISSVNADEGGRSLAKLLDHVHAVVRFNRQSGDRFDGMHLDIEPQQRPENKGTGNLRFLPGLVEAYRSVRALADAAGLTVNADIQKKLLEGDLEQRRSLMSALPRLTLMLYELSSPTDGRSEEEKAQKLRQTDQEMFDLAYKGLDDPNLARLAIALRTPDYNELLPDMLKTVDETERANPRYLGWARHSYNDMLQ
jgi:hypothetical protein